MRHGPSKPYSKYTEEQKQRKRRVVRLYARAHKKEKAAYMKKYWRTHKKQKAAYMRQWRRSRKRRTGPKITESSGHLCSYEMKCNDAASLNAPEVHRGLGLELSHTLDNFFFGNNPFVGEKLVECFRQEHVVLRDFLD